MLAIIIFLILSALTIVGWIQIIVKAGYSPWWILIPVSIPVLWLINITLVYSDFSGVGSYGAFNLQTFADEEAAFGIFIFLDVIVTFVMFLVFAFSEWPVLRAARSGAARPGRAPQFGARAASPYGAGFAGPGGSAGPAVSASAAVMAPALPNLEGQAPGWYTSGPVGAGEQSYWDGAVWSARRRWQKDAWVDLPIAAPPPASGPQP